MNKKAKILTGSFVGGFAVILASVYFLSAPAPSMLQANVFSDTSSSPYNDAITYIETNGIASGYPDGTFKPGLEINRAEFTKILVQTAFPNEIETYKAKSCFNDVQTSAWFSKYVCLAKDKGIIGGYPDGTFRPNQNIDVTESLKMTLEALEGSGISAASGDWYQKYLNFAYSKGYMLGEWTDLSKKITRGEMAQFLYQIKVPEAPARGISVNYYDDETMDPLDVITLKGSGFDPLAATSVIFTTLQGGQTYVVPAVNVSSDSIDVSVPAVAYDKAQGLFTGANVSIQVIQARGKGDNFSVVASNKMGDLDKNTMMITYQKSPAAYEKDAIKNLPKGMIAAAFLAVSLENLQDVGSKLPVDNATLQAFLADSEDGMRQLIVAVRTIARDPTAKVDLKTDAGISVTLDVNEVAVLDAIFLNFLGEMEAHNVTSFNDNSWSLIPTADAAQMSECVRNTVGDGIGDPTFQRAAEDACGITEPMATGAKKVSKLIVPGATLVYGFPLVVGGMMFGAFVEGAALGCEATQIALMAGYSFLADAIVEGTTSASNASSAIARAVADRKLGVPILDAVASAAKFLYEVNEVLHPNEVVAEKEKVIISVSGKDKSQATIVGVVSAGTGGVVGATLTAVDLPLEGQSKVVSKNSGEVAVAKKKVVPKPKPTPVPVPTQEICFYDSDCSTGKVCNQGVCEKSTPVPTPVPTPTSTSKGSITLSSATCIHKSGEDSYYNKGNYVQTSGTMTGPVGAHVEWSSGDGPEECGSWHRGSQFYGPCTRQEGDPESSTWTLTQPANSESWWYEILILAPDGWETYQRIEYGDVCNN